MAIDGYDFEMIAQNKESILEPNKFGADNKKLSPDLMVIS